MKNLNIILIIICFLQSLVGNAKPNQNASVHCRAPFLLQQDSVVLEIYNPGVFQYYASFRKVYNIKVVNGGVDFTFPVGDHPVYMSLALHKRFEDHSLNSYLVSPGDNITITFRPSGIGPFFDKFEFGGYGSKFWNLQYKLKKLSYWCFRKSSWKINKLKENFERLDSTRNVQLSMLDSVRNVFSSPVLNMLRGDILGEPENMKFYWCDDLFSTPELKDSVSNAILTLKLYRNPFKLKDYAQSEFFSKSEFLAEGIVSNYNLDSVLMQKQEINLKKGYADLKQIFSGDLRERILSFYFYAEKEQNIDPELLRDALGYFINPLFTGVLRDLQKGRVEGATAFEFNLPDSSGIRHQMSDFKGKAVVLDFWFTGCGPCRKLGPIMKELEEKYKDRNIQFITVAIDKKKDLWKKSLREQKYASSLSLNLFTDGLGDDDTTINHYRVDAFPTVIIIGKDGHLLKIPKFFLLDDAADLKKLVAEAAE